MALDVDKIGLAALDMLDEVGLDGLSTRRLAASLNIRGPSLYKHFQSKAELLDHMVGTMLASGFQSLDPSLTWPDWLRGLARSSRESISRYRDGARVLITSSPNSPRRIQLATTVSQPLVDAGFTPFAARHAVATLASFVVGWMLNEQNEATRGMMVESFGDVSEAFEESVEIIVAGLLARHPLLGRG